MARIGLQLWTVRDELEDLDTLFGRLADIGVEAVEPFGLGNPSVPVVERIAHATALSAAARRAGIAIPSTHTFLPSLDDVGQLVDELQALGATTALAAVPESLNGFGRDAFSSTDSIEAYADRLNALASAVSSDGLRVGYHNHAWEWEQVAPGRLAYDHLLDHLSPEVVIELDVLWAQFAGQDPIELIERLGERIAYLHIDDASPVTNTDHQVPAGQGDVPLARALEAAPASLDVLYIEATTPPPGSTHLDLVAASADWLRSRLQPAL